MTNQSEIDWDKYGQELYLTAQKIQQRINDAPIKVEARWKCNCGQAHTSYISIDSEQELQPLLHQLNQQGSQVLNIWRKETPTPKLI